MGEPEIGAKLKIKDNVPGTLTFSAKLEAIKLAKRINEIDDLDQKEKRKIKKRLEAIIDLIEIGF